MKISKDGEYEIRELAKDEWSTAIALAWRIFLQFEAPGYTTAGIRSFKDFIEDPKLKKQFINGEYTAFGAFHEAEMVGMMGIRNGNHISLLFVDERYHKKGVATALFSYFLQQEKRQEIINFTVNAAPYAIGFYHKLGFCDDDKEVVADGICFTPMHLRIR
jgi:GNAT superfamily N-acetyltransferase